MLQVHSLSTTWICFDGMGRCNKIQHSQSGVCTEACRQVLLQWLPPNQQCHFNAAKTWLGGPSIKARTEKIRNIYRIVNDLVEIPADQYLTAAGVSTRGHQQRFLVQYCSINAYKGSFFLSAVRLWNSLPASAISAPTMDDFKILISVRIPRP